jgi:arylsulfatase A-like enzyme/tetratricopeptide (TPR) repeat protein
VITLDTIRTDRLGAYGNSRVRTPFVDGLAKRGVTFDRCIAPTPLTLPSHTSLFTGTYPPYHGVRDNGNYVVPDEITTMAELFREAGYHTAAFVGAYVLSARWGLDQGFETYTEPRREFDPELLSFADIQRRADDVVDDAISWLENQPRSPFFAWVHLYDPHLPYDPPPPFDREYADDPYLGEVAFSDAQMSRLDAYLQASGLGSSTLIVFAGDHGEGLGDHGEFDHGLLLYQTTIRAPLVIVHPSLERATARRQEVVSLVDVLPTITEAVGISTPEDLHGRSLLPLLGGDGRFDERPAYAETHYPRLHFGWSPLESIQDRRFQLIRSSAPELYDLDDDPGQDVDLYSTGSEVARRMDLELNAMTERLGRGALDASSAPDAATIARLAALGYVTGDAVPSDEQTVEDLPTPSSMLWLYNLMIEASATIRAGDETAGEEKLLEIVESDDDMVDAWLALGRLYRRQGRFADSLTALRQAHDRRPLDPFVVAKLADALISTRQLQDAEQILSAALVHHPDDPYLVFSLARVLENDGRTGDAEAMYRRSLSLDPQSAPTHVRLAAIALQQGDLTQGEREVDAALRIDPGVPEASLMHGQILESRGQLDDAAQAYRNELRSSPRSLPAALALSRLEGRRGRFEEQEAVLRDAIRANPRSPGPYMVLALTFLQRQERYDEAVELVELALEQGPQGRELQMAYMLLANLHTLRGDTERAAEYARLAQQVP